MRTFVPLSLLLALLPLHAATVTSPNHRIAVSVEVKDLLEPYPAGKRLYYSVRFDGKLVLADSPFRLDFKGAPPFARDLAITSEKRAAIDETWRPVWGTASQVRNQASELTLALEETAAPHRRLNFIVRAYDNGAAFRYQLPAQPGLDEFKLAAEHSSFYFAANHTAWAANYGSFTSPQEDEFKRITLNQIRPGDVIGCPLLIDTGAAWVALTEANLTDWAGTYFTAVAGAPNAVETLLSPHPDEPGVAVTSRAPRFSPWRVMMLGERAGDLIESNLIANLNEPSAIADTSWIQPGISAWDRWWPGGYAPDFNGKLTMSTASQKYFVDFAAAMGWRYQLTDWTWYGEPFDPAAKPFTTGNPASDLGKPVPELDVPALVRYAKQKGIGIWLWLEWSNADKQMERAFPIYEKWGVAGVKVDFMNRDDQSMVNFYDRLVKLAAKHHLMVDFHGAFKPTGTERTWPNLVTREGVMGNEYNKWSDKVTPAHTVTVPFTRMLAGPMDFTPGGFRHKTPKTFRAIGGDAPGPFVMGTRAHQLAMMVVYFSPLQVMCDSPYSYRASPGGLDFLKRVPTTWDETRFLDGYPGDYVVVARRSGQEWFIGGMSGDKARDVKLPLGFLGAGKWDAHIWADAEEVDDYPEHLAERGATYQSSGQLNVHMGAAGGFVVHLTRAR